MSQPVLQRHLGLWSAVLLVVGSVIGSGIFMKPLDISRSLPDEGWIFGAWAALGVICLFGALAYGELGAMFPQAGGQYAFLREAYGPFIAFLYGWCLLLVINTGTLAALCVVFAQNMDLIVPMGDGARFAVAASMVLALALVNHYGVRWGTLLQNTSTVAKLLALGAIVVGGLAFASGGGESAAPRPEYPIPDLVTGMVAAAVALFWAYEGWHQLAFSAAEMKNPEKDLWRGLAIGIFVLVAVYVLVNIAYLNVIPVDEMRHLKVDRDVPTLTVERVFGGEAGAWLAALICLSVFGAANPNLLSTPRAFYAMARDGQVPSVLMRIHPRWQTPHIAIWSQAVWAIVLVWVLGTFKDITEFVVFAALIFYALVVAGVYVLRSRLPDRERPYRCWGYPVTPALFIATVLFVDFRLLTEPADRENALYGLGVIAVGALVYVFRGVARRSRTPGKL
ncbi:MAG: amino acid permease [Planctomycetes bacterium]|nr:amino acid permease [Planctomycetota bacterium]